MANSLREVKQRITSTESTAQITKAMYMVSSSKVKKAERIYKGYQDFMKLKEELVSLMVSKMPEDLDLREPIIPPCIRHLKRDLSKRNYLRMISYVVL